MIHYIETGSIVGVLLLQCLWPTTLCKLRQGSVPIFSNNSSLHFTINFYTHFRYCVFKGSIYMMALIRGHSYLTILLAMA